MVTSFAKSLLTRRSFIRRSSSVVGALSIGGAVLTACGGGSSSSGTVHIYSLYGAELPDDGVKDFQKKNPDIKVTNDNYDATKLASMLAANNAPDVVRIDGGAGIPNFAARGIAADLSSYFQSSSVIKEDDLFPVNDYYRWDGHVQGKGARYGLVKDWSTDVGIWYNKKLLDQAGLPHPDPLTPLTYNQILDMAKKLTVSKDGKIVSYGFSASWGWNTQAHILEMMAQQKSGATFFNSDFSQVDFTTSECMKAFQWYVDYAQAHVGPSPLDPEPTGDAALFAAERLAIIDYGYWFGGAVVGTATNGLPDHVGVAPTPLFGPNSFMSTGAATGVFIPAKSKNKDAAWRFVEYFFGGDGAIARAKQGWGAPALKSLVKYLPQTPDFKKESLTVLNQAEIPHFGLLHFSPYLNNDAAESAIDKALEPVMKGQQSLSSTLQQLTQTINTMMQQAKEQVQS